MTQMFLRTAQTEERIAVLEKQMIRVMEKLDMDPPSKSIDEGDLSPGPLTFVPTKAADDEWEAAKPPKPAPKPEPEPEPEPEEPEPPRTTIELDIPKSAAERNKGWKPPSKIAQQVAKRR